MIKATIMSVVVLGPTTANGAIEGAPIDGPEVATRGCRGKFGAACKTPILTG